MCSKQVGCPVGCDSCAAGACVSCEDSQPFLLGNGSCVGACPANHAVVLASGSYTCARCHENCGDACVGPAANECTRCDSIGVHAYLLNGACVLSCPERYFADDERVCRPCALSCKTCSGSRAADCTSCTPNACATSGTCPEGVVFPLLDHGRCISNCPAGTFADSTTQRCLDCHAACQLCTGPNHTQCVDPTPRTPFGDADCANGATRRGGQTTCVLPCPVGKYLLSGGECLGDQQQHLVARP